MYVLNGNWIDLIIICLLVYFASTAWMEGFLNIVSGFVSFFLSFALSLRLYKFTASFLQSNFNLGTSLSNALGFIATSIILEILLNATIGYVLTLLPEKIVKSKINKFLGLIPALGEGIILIAFLLTAAVVLPIRPDVKKAVSESKIGGFLLTKTGGLEKDVNQVFGGAINDALTYFTIEPGSHDTLKLDSAVGNLTIDSAAENKMLTDLNNERTSRGLAALSIDSRYVKIARDYAKDMWTRHYFSHYNPEGKTVADRFTAAGISYEIVGENLALAPTEETAHTGLMNSSGHRANILEPQYHKIGIGVIDNGIYGKIFVQEFSN